MLYNDRREAGAELAQRLAARHYPNPVVLALPRGGLPVAAEIARALGAPLGLVLVRKIGAPGDEEFAIGAMAEGNPPELVLDKDVVRMLHVPQDYIDTAKAKALHEIERRRRTYCGTRPPPELAGRTAIITDDGIATGATMLAALRAVRRQNPARLVLAVPLASPEALARLRGAADEIICLHKPVPFVSIGQFYRYFPQLSDAEVIALLGEPEGDKP